MKSKLNIIPKKWQTKRLILSDSILSDVDKLQKIYEEGFREEWVGKFNKPTSNYIKKYIANPELPPKGTKERQRLQTIRTKKDKSIIGYLDVYHGWPKKDIFWVGDLFLSSGVQGQKYGREIINGLVKEINKFNSYKHLRCNVRLKNWPAIRFWARIGFSKIVGYSGDKKYSINKFADLTLEMNIREYLKGIKTDWMEL